MGTKSQKLAERDKARAIAERFLALVNDEDQGKDLRSWTERWLSAGRELTPALCKELNALTKHYGEVLLPSGIEELNTPEPVMDPGTTLTGVHLPEATGGPVRFYASTRGLKPFQAATFRQFVTGRHAHALERCGRKGCSRYFLLTGKRRKYCSTECAWHDTAVKATTERQQRKTDERLSRARRVCRKFQKSGKWPGDWKKQVATAAGTKKNWVTRHVNLGHLPGPD